MEEAFKCDLCSEEFNSRYLLNIHLEHRHEIRRDRKTKNFKCNVCGGEFSTGQHLLNHMKKHATGERPFKCTVADCGRAFKMEGTLSDHIKYKHSDDSLLFKCEFPGCHYSTQTYSILCRHKKMHSDERLFLCLNDECNFRAKRSRNLRAHVRNAHSAAEAFACSKCEYKTAHKRYLNRHILIHSERKNVKCSHPQCTKSFKSLRDLQGHFNRRHGERSTKCDHPSCAKKFANDTALRDHQRNVHARRDHARSNLNCIFSTSTTTKLADEMTVHDGSNEKISCSMDHLGLADSIGFACTLCDFVGDSEEAALNHAKCHRQPAFHID